MSDRSKILVGQNSQRDLSVGQAEETRLSERSKRLAGRTDR